MKTFRSLATAAAALMATVAAASAQAPKPEPGLVVTYTVNGASDLAVVPNVALFTVAGQPVTPFLPPGNFTATWEGWLSVDLRGDYQFAAELNGAVKIEANGAVVYESDGMSAEPSKSVRLNKGTNAFKVSYTAPASG